jgi:hypothetical protein
MERPVVDPERCGQAAPTLILLGLTAGTIALLWFTIRLCSGA